MALIATSLLLLTTPLLANAQTDNGNECSCFRTNNTVNYFQFHRFYDYRNVDSSMISNPVPDAVTTASGAASAGVTNNYFQSNAFTQDWSIQTWNNSGNLGGQSGSDATILMVNSASNIYIEQSTDSSPDYNSFLTLRTSRQTNFQSAAEIDSTEQNFLHMSARFMARVIGSPGACAGLFTYLSPTDPKNPMTVQEADIEILTNGPRNMVQYTNQPSNAADGRVLAQASSNVTNPNGIDWTQWLAYRVDWTPSMTQWYVNGENVASIGFQTPRDPAGLIINMWGDGGSWTGNMTTFDEAYLQIQYIEVVYNTSGSYGGAEAANNGIQSRDENGALGLLQKRKKHVAGCKVVCSVDDQVNVTGTPALIYNNTGAAGIVVPGGNSGPYLLSIALVLSLLFGIW
ncbi:hypothetical protein BP6252_02104 [Coleophoma cylindrospora]|uniref:GH16 domain-containing protein n=1 Tax=Coleophoma cylindrospora TaxID=1849047 RepID=A0A3D8SEI3_9HELO|nr:hypothetical protein BP6252_02104 [Coleophoma cylindrospora]